jgi:hypothetical protein
MTSEQEKIAEDMVAKMKAEKGSTDWQKYRDMKSIPKLDIILIVQALKELKILEDIIPGSSSIRLTEIGWHWLGFSEERRIEHQQKNTQDEINQLTLKKLKLEQFPAKFWWVVILLTAAISILTTWINNRIEDSRKKPEINKNAPLNFKDTVKVISRP